MTMMTYYQMRTLQALSVVHQTPASKINDCAVHIPMRILAELKYGKIKIII